MKQLNISSDPADEIVAATSLIHDAPLVTRDRALRRSKVIPLASLRS
jgi:PIN domain nuclease of toxin-antitoxin system